MPRTQTSGLSLTLCGFALLLLFSAGVLAQGLPGLTSQFIADTWTKERGLSDNSVRAITQTTDGYIWIATREGLTRFDGTRFVIFNRANTPALPSDEFTCLTPGRDGELWIGTMNGLVRRSSSGGFSTWLDGLPGRSSEISGVFITYSGEVWVGSHQGVHRLRGWEFELTQLPALPVWEEPSGKLWLAGSAGLYHFDSASGKISKPLLPPDLPSWGAGNSAGVVALSNGRVYAQFGQHEREARLPEMRNWLYEFSGGNWTPVPDNPFFSRGRPFFLSPDHGGGIWLPDGGTRVLRLKDGVLARLAFPLESENDFPICMFHDHEGNIWVGLEDRGVVRFRAKRLLTLNAPQALPADGAWALCESRDGSVWIGTDGGISRWRNGALTHFSRSDGLIRNSVRAIAEDHTGTIWVGTGRGLSLFRDGAWQQFAVPGELGGNKIRALHVDRAGDLWVGSERGLAQIHRHELVPCAAARDLADVDVRALLQDRSGALWIGTYGHGLYRLQGSALNRFTTTNGLASDIIWAIHEDSDGALWLGGDCGLQRYRGNRFRHFSRRDGLPHEDVNYILDDDFANLWISSDSGVYRVAKAQLEAVAEGRQPAVTPIVYGLRDGLPSVETNGRKSQPAGCKTRDGRLWFPTIRGVAVFDPRNLPDNPHPPRMVIEQILADGQSIFHNGPGGVADPAHGDANPSAVQRFDSLQAELRLAPGTAHVLEIHYTANTFIASDKVTFKYRLDGLDPDWIEAGHRRFAQYANLKPGQYRFRVIGVNKYGVAAEQPASFAFYLSPHFYQRRGVRAACLAAAALLAFLAYRWRLGYVRRIHQLERDRALAEDRARIARDLHDGLGAQLTNLTILADTANQQADAAQTIESRFRKLSQLARETAVQLREVIWANHPGDESLEGLISRICQYAEQSLGAAGIRCRFDIPVDLPAAPLKIDARHHIYLAVKEILHNIVKHSSASEVRLQGAIQEDSLRLTIEDNGSGLVGSNRHFPNSGHGLQNIRRRIESLAGDVAITGEPGHGVCFNIVVPSAGLFSPRDNGKVNAARPRASHDHASLDRRGRH